MASTRVRPRRVSKMTHANVVSKVWKEKEKKKHWGSYLTGQKCHPLAAICANNFQTRPSALSSLTI